MGTAIRCTDLRKTYPGKPPVEAVRGIDLAVDKGECFGVLGPNGAGKTTTIEMLEGLLEPTAGEVEILGIRWRDDPQAIRRQIGISLQETRFSDKLTVRETLTLFRSFYREGIEPAAAIARVSLEEKAEHLDQEPLRRAEAAAGGGRGPGRRSGVAVPRRADHGPRSALPPRGVGDHLRMPPPRAHHCADDALHGRGRTALRPRGHHRPGPGDCAGVAAAIDRAAGRRAHRRVLRSPAARRGRSRPARRLARPARR